MPDNGAWHMKFNPTGMDSTLCGCAWEGMGEAINDSEIRKEKKATIKAITCEHCRDIIAFCKDA